MEMLVARRHNCEWEPKTISKFNSLKEPEREGKHAQVYTYSDWTHFMLIHFTAAAAADAFFSPQKICPIPDIIHNAVFDDLKRKKWKKKSSFHINGERKVSTISILYRDNFSIRFLLSLSGKLNNYNNNLTNVKLEYCPERTAIFHSFEIVPRLFSYIPIHIIIIISVLNHHFQSFTPKFPFLRAQKPRISILMPEYSNQKFHIFFEFQAHQQNWIMRND